jgi:hypothetical protein
VKSLTEANEEGQLRMALGQVKRYAPGAGGRGVRPRQVIAVECHPFDETWIDLCNDEGIVLVWPEVIALALNRPSACAYLLKELETSRKNRVELCFTPTYAAWADPIQAQFGRSGS